MTGQLCDGEGVVMQCDEDDKEKERKGNERAMRDARDALVVPSCPLRVMMMHTRNGQDQDQDKDGERRR